MRLDLFVVWEVVDPFVELLTDSSLLLMMMAILGEFLALIFIFRLDGVYSVQLRKSRVSPWLSIDLQGGY